MTRGLVVLPVDGLPEVTPGADLAGMLSTVPGLTDGDVLVVTSKVVSKAEGRIFRGDRSAAVQAETVRVVARRGETRIVENRQGLVMAAAGVDASNVAPGTVVLLPEDPDRSARGLREEVRRRTGRNVAVVVSDTAGRAWRLGQTDIAIGVAGLAPLEDFFGRVDGYGNELAVTAPAVADEIAGAAELVAGKLGGRPVTVVRGLAQRVLRPDDHGPGARTLQRPADSDLFALGAREAVVAAISGGADVAFGAPAGAAELAVALQACGYTASVVRPTAVEVPAAADDPLLGALLRAHRWRVDSEDGVLTLAALP
jgi:coenzyme F420-0:L-glutamate ligase/coenzyme F420-1:gamma-L-glutamate ligase